MLEAAVAEVRGPAPTHPGSREQRSLRPPTKIPSGQHGLWGHNAASRPPPLPRRRVALARTNLTVKRDGLTMHILSSWYGPRCGQVFWLPDHGPSPAFPSGPPRRTGCSVAYGGDGLPGYSGATAPELHRTSLDPHLLGAVFHGGVGFPFGWHFAEIGARWKVEELES